MCKYLSFDGKCQLWDDTDIQFEHIVNSCDEYGYCLVDEDEYPLNTCEDYQS